MDWRTAISRTGGSPVEQKALGKVQSDLAAMPASLVVQIALWPVRLADWARDKGVSPGMVYNCLAAHKPYEPVRELLAESLGVSRSAIDHLIEARAPAPRSLVPPDPVPVRSSPPPEPLSRPASPVRQRRPPAPLSQTSLAL